MFENYSLTDLEKYLKCKEFLREKIPLIKEQFIIFYGDALRDKINDMFNNALLIAYKIPIIEELLLERIKCLITKKIIKRNLLSNSLWNIDDLIKDDFSDISFSYEKMLPLKKFVDFYIARENGQDSKHLEELFEEAKPLLEKVDKNITCANYYCYASNPKLQELEFLAKEYPRMLHDYKMAMAKYNKEQINVDSFLKARDIQLNPGDERFKNQQKEIDESMPEHREIREEIDKLNLLNKNDGFDSSIYGMGVLASTNSNLRILNGDYNLFSLILVNCSNLNSSSKFDHYIIHELNHLFESFLLNVDRKSYDVLSGWDIVKHELDSENSENDSKKESEFRPYELFNEIINDMISQEIVMQMHQNGIFIFDQESDIEQPPSSYQNTRFLVDEFYKRYRDKIIESRRDGNIEIIWNEVGKENFEELNNLFKEFKHEKDLYLTIGNPRRKELENKRDEILRKMEEYRKSNNTYVNNTDVKK